MSTLNPGKIVKIGAPLNSEIVKYVWNVWLENKQITILNKQDKLCANILKMK